MSCEKDEEVIGTLTNLHAEVKGDTLLLYFEAYNEGGVSMRGPVEVDNVSVVIDGYSTLHSKNIDIESGDRTKVAKFAIEDLECDVPHHIIEVCVSINNSSITKDVSDLGLVIEDFKVTETIITNVTDTKCGVKSNVNNSNRKRLTSVGFCYSSTRETPTIEDSTLEINNIYNPSFDENANSDYSTDSIISLTADGFSAEIVNLKPETTYYVRAFVKTASGDYFYGDVTEVKMKGSVKTSYEHKYLGEEVVAVEVIGTVFDIDRNNIESYGFCYSQTIKEPIKDISFTETKGSASEFREILKQLSLNATYYVRAYITTKYGTLYGDVQTIRTSKTFVDTYVYPINNTATKIRCSGSVADIDNSHVKAYGFCYSATNTTPTKEDAFIEKDGAVSEFTEELTDLTPYQKYFIRAYVITKYGILYGDVQYEWTNSVSVTTDHIPPLQKPATTLICSGSVSDIESSYIKTYGFCYSATNSTPTKDDAFIEKDDAASEFTEKLTDLTPGQKYFIRAYVITKHGIHYGNVQYVWTSRVSVKTTNSNYIPLLNATTLICSGSVSDIESSYIKTYGFCYSATNSTPTKDDAFVEKDGAVSEFTEKITDLTPGQKYFMRAYVITKYGIHYGDVQYEWTNSVSVKTTDVLAVDTVIRCSGSVSNIESSYIESYGVCFSTTNSTPTKDDSFVEKDGAVSEFTETLTNLTPGQRYFIRAYVITKYGIHYGDIQEKSANIVSVKTVDLVATDTGVKCSGTVSNIDVSNIYSYGFCYSLSNTTPTLEDDFVQVQGSALDFEETITKLELSSYYINRCHVRAYIVTKYGIYYGNILRITL